MSGTASIVPLGPSRPDQILVAVGLNLSDSNYAVGWVDRRSLNERVVGGVVLADDVGQDKQAQDSENPPVTVEAGAALLSESGENVGVVRHDTELPCLSKCDTTSPTVQIRCVVDFPAVVVPAATGPTD